MAAMSGESSGGAVGKREWSVEDLLDRSQKCLDHCNPEMAVRFVRRAAEMAPDDCTVFDHLAEV